MDDSLLPVTSLRENLTQTHLDFSYFRTTEPKLTPALRKMPFTNLRLTIWTGDLFHKQTIIYRVTYNIVQIIDKFEIFLNKKEILSIQNDGYLIDKMAKNVIMNKDCTLWRNDVSEKKQKGISGTDTDPAVWTEYDRSDRDVHSVWYMDRQEI